MIDSPTVSVSSLIISVVYVIMMKSWLCFRRHWAKACQSEYHVGLKNSHVVFSISWRTFIDYQRWASSYHRYSMFMLFSLAKISWYSWHFAALFVLISPIVLSSHFWSRPTIHLSWVKGQQRQQHGSWVARKDAVCQPVILQPEKSVHLKEPVVTYEARTI